MKKKREWKRKDARDAWYIIKYYKPSLELKTVSITNKSKKNLYTVPRGTPLFSSTKAKGVPVSRQLGQYGLFITFKRKGMGKGEKLPYFTNGWAQPLTLMSALERFFASLYMYDGVIKGIKKFNPDILDELYVNKKKSIVRRNDNVTKILEAITKISYWGFDKKGREGRVHV